MVYACTQPHPRPRPTCNLTGVRCSAAALPNSCIQFSPAAPRRVQSDWRVVQRGYYAHVLGEAPHYFQDPVEAVRTLKKGNAVSGGGTVHHWGGCAWQGEEGKGGLHATMVWYTGGGTPT